MTLLALLLAIDAALHALLVYRFGIKENMSFFVYVFVDAEGEAHQKAATDLAVKFKSILGASR